MAAAWIGFAGGVLAAVVSGFVVMRRYRLEREPRAEEVLARYREPLAAAAYDLQSRLYNILELEFFEHYGSGERAEEALRTTCSGSRSTSAGRRSCAATSSSSTSRTTTRRGAWRSFRR